MNQALINEVLQNKKYYLNLFRGKAADEIIDDAFQDTILQFLNKTNIVENGNYRAYFQIALRTFIYQNLNKLNRFQGVETELDGEVVNLYDSSTNDVCYYEMIEAEQYKQYQLKKMYGHIENLVGKQKEAVNNVLVHNGSMNDSNFKQAIRKLRLAMGGSLFRTNAYVPLKDRTGRTPYLTKEAVIDIRKNIRRNSKGEIINKRQLAEKYNVSKFLIGKVVRNLKYEGK